MREYCFFAVVRLTPSSLLPRESLDTKALTAILAEMVPV